MEYEKQNSIPEKASIEAIWDKFAGERFSEPELKRLNLDGISFIIPYLPEQSNIEPQKEYIQTGLNFCALPRIAGYKYRFVLVPLDNINRSSRWEVCYQDIFDWILWANHMNHIVTMSTFKSGAGVPFSIHAQSIPFYTSNNVCLTALADIKTEVLIDFNRMPFFKDLQIRKTVDYPANGLKFTGADSVTGLEQVAKKTFELALNYDGLKTFNLVIIPSKGLSSSLFFFPRRKDGNCIYGPNRWQIAAMELNGLLPIRTKNEFDSINITTITDIFSQTCPCQKEFDDFLILINTF
jgi:hypothetical protein